jgi:hypothetical protein
MLMASRAPFGQNLSDFDCSCMFWLPFRVEAKLGLSKRASVPAATALNENVYAKSESHGKPTLALGISPAHRSNRVIAVGTPSLWTNLLCRMGKAGDRSPQLPISPSVVSEATAEEGLGSLMRVCGGRF